MRIGSRFVRTLATAAALLTAALASPAALAGDVTIVASKDNTLIEDPNGALSNGAGPALFVGRTGQTAGAIRRAVIAFDVAGQIPAGMIVTDVRLTLAAAQVPAASTPVALHRLIANWGEGTSLAGGENGAPATSGDATWIHRFFDTDLWIIAGGDFNSVPSASIDIDVPGLHTWGSTPEMVADVQSWLDAPAGNFGWALVGNESAPQTLAVFASREADPNLAILPVLEIEYEPPCVNPRWTGPGYWNRQCLGVPKDQGGLKPGKGKGPKAPTEPNFVSDLMPCAAGILADLGIAATTCEGIDPRPRNDKCEKALRKLTTLVLNVCSDRLQTSCPVNVAPKGCFADDVGDLIEEIAGLVLGGDCRKAMRCAGVFED